MNENEKSIAVIPYLVYDALMERFEKTQKNLRASLIASSVLAVCFVFSLFGALWRKNGNCKNSQHD